jgi:dihydrofolate reductase
MKGGTTFHFVDGGIYDALTAAREAAGDSDVLVGGGAATIRQYLAAGLIDDMHLALVPVLLGSGQPLFENLGAGIGDYECVEHVCSPAVTHVRIVRSR